METVWGMVWIWGWMVSGWVGGDMFFDISLKLFLKKYFGCCDLFHSRLVGIYRKGEW